MGRVWGRYGVGMGNGVAGRAGERSEQGWRGGGEGHAREGMVVGEAHGAWGS